MSYNRVTPRDLFNESKLLKCLGFLSLAILDGKLSEYGATEELEDEGLGFVIGQDPMDGHIYCANYKVIIPMMGVGSNISLHLFTRLNSKAPFPLMCTTQDEDIEVFHEDGTLTEEFLDFLKYLNEITG